MKRLIDDDFNDDHDVTVGVEFGSYLVKVEEKILKLQIWDTAGQECFRSITKIFYRGAHVVLLSYSILQGASFENLSGWLKEVRTQCSPDVMLFLVGNKCDMDNMRVVTADTILEYKEQNQIPYAMECSAKTGKNVERLFTDCARFLYLKYHDKLGEVGNAGDLSSENNDSFANNSFESQGRRNGGSFLESRGHKAGKLNGRRKSRKKKKCSC